ncbi:hypothetical protein K8F61_17305 [Microbacterium resistens]|uniref:DNA polymerase III beta sliding clamp central domain-containing protein n=1 Tax=Microbacterium resistens TaxID=156977 RepID=A0ABY3RV86_9MICO|nr:hypothetical protein [Microbacterium resistens]UGS26362.1 hypothetical protein K8F61_17305 [Microbacterium resistens]
MSGTVRLPAERVRWLLRGALAAASRDDVTPVLTAVHWTVGDGRVTVTTTDRYRVHQLCVPAPAGTPDGAFLMSRHQAELLKQWGHGKARSRPLEVVDLTWTDPEAGKLVPGERVTRRHVGTVQFDIWEFDGSDADRMTHLSDQVRGNFPPVARLFDQFTDTKDEPRAAELALNPEFLSATRHLREAPGDPLRVMMPSASERDTSETGGSSLRPLVVMNFHGTARALIQPNLALRVGAEFGA